jgi:hypothetical protein
MSVLLYIEQKLFFHGRFILWRFGSTTGRRCRGFGILLPGAGVRRGSVKIPGSGVALEVFPRVV